MASRSPVPRIALEPVVVDDEACRELAALIRSRTIPADQEETPVQGLTPREIGNFYLLLVAICHQTSPRDKPPLEGSIGDRNLRGWDYLAAKLETDARINPEILTPEFWSTVNVERVLELFRDEALGDRLSDPEGRASLIRDLGCKMLQRSWKWADQIYNAGQRSVATGPRSIVKLLSDFRAYDDPVRKKSFFLLALMHNVGLWVYIDPDKLGAPVDYHEVRGHLRLGTVQIQLWQETGAWTP